MNKSYSYQALLCHNNTHSSKTSFFLLLFFSKTNFFLFSKWVMIKQTVISKLVRFDLIRIKSIRFKNKFRSKVKTGIHVNKFLWEYNSQPVCKEWGFWHPGIQSHFKSFFHVNINMQQWYSGPNKDKILLHIRIHSQCFVLLAFPTSRDTWVGCLG